MTTFASHASILAQAILAHGTSPEFCRPAVSRMDAWDANVVIRTTDGTRWVLKMPPNSTVLELRRRISDELQIPEAFQILVDPLGAILERPSDLILEEPDELMLVISLEPICAKLESLDQSW